MATKTFLETRVLVEKLLREVRAHPLFMTTWIFLRVILALATFANITWLLVRHGQRSQSALDAACKSRSEEPDGFAGDPEFYGLGIRLGVYFQWLTDLITMGYLEEERQYALMTYHIFSISITVALFVKVFTSPCTFSAEIFLVLVLFWGGYNIVQIPMMQAMSLNKIHQLRKEDPARFETPRSVRKLRWSIQLLNFIMYPITIWFWTRIAAVADGVDFGSTPGGTAFFFFGRIHGHGLKPFGIFMVTSSALSFIGAICGLIPMPSWTLDKRNGNKLSSLLITIAWFPLNAIVFFPSITLTLLTAFLMAAFSRPAKLLTRYLRMHRSQVDVEHGTGRLRVSRLESGKAEGSDLGTKEGVSSALIKSKRRYESLFPFSVAAWCVIAIELTLAWNSVSDVYEVETAGQIIPLVTGMGGLIDVFWKMCLNEKPKQKQENGGEKIHESGTVAIKESSVLDFGPRSSGSSGGNLKARDRRSSHLEKQPSIRRSRSV